VVVETPRGLGEVSHQGDRDALRDDTEHHDHEKTKKKTGFQAESLHLQTSKSHLIACHEWLHGNG
jgi:hypothetical protein